MRVRRRRRNRPGFSPRVERVSAVRVGLAEQTCGMGQDAEADYDAEDQHRHSSALMREPVHATGKLAVLHVSSWRGVSVPSVPGR